MSRAEALWDWALAAYARPGVAEACLALQDQHGQSVCYLLWALWARTAEASALSAAAAAARSWEAEVLGPLRGVRRALKAELPGGARVERDGLRALIKDAELCAERTLLETLQSMGPRAAAPAPALEALEAATAAWGRAAPKPALAVLASALG
jgi:uncharacterized protein (TIGR02444 family)